jgi:3'-phosphoadenosine 5'-phosphosulfate sulfotransferase (PAPS reductase)/FAD synthetase
MQIMKILIFYSGGKDSQACLLLAVEKYGADRCEAVFCDTGWENPVTYEHIVSTTSQLNVKLVILKSEKYDGMIDLATKKKRFPSPKARFCTEELKSKPVIDYVLSHKEHLIIIEGIRKNESLSRSLMQDQCTYFKYYFQPMLNGKKHTYRKKDVKKWASEYSADKIRPVFNWTAQQVIDYIRENRQEPNSLYFQGFSRVGCFPCIMSRHREVKLIIDNHTDQWKLLTDTEGKVGTSFFPPSYIPMRFTTGVTEKGKKFCTAQDVEKYLSRNDLQLDLYEEQTPSCMSMYGLCE